jgi:sugar/nucleoside kinase (ribokinase family)
MRAVVVGDCLLDISVEHGPIAPGGDRPARIRLSPGGQGANVAVRLARRGVATRLLGALGDDFAGALLHDHLIREGVELTPLSADRSGAVAVLLDGDGERTMLSDRASLDVQSLVAASGALGDADWIHVSGYALREAAGEALTGLLAARRPVSLLSVDGGSVTSEDAGLFADRLARCHPDLLIVNRHEAAALTGAAPREQLVELAARLAARAPVAVVTGGSAGSAAVRDGDRIALPAPELPRPAVDGTGAGDAYTASLIAGLAGAEWPPDPAELRRAMEAASAAGGEAAGLHGAQARVSGE